MTDVDRPQPEGTVPSAPLPMSPEFEAKLCASGLLSHKWKRVIRDSRDGSLRCSQCKKVYDADVLDGTDCPRCNVAMKPPKTSHHRCVRCGVIR